MINRKDFTPSVHPLNGKPYLAIEVVKKYSERGYYDGRIAYYYLAIPVDELDIRSNSEDKIGVYNYHLSMIGKTDITGGYEENDISMNMLPFRDGVHIKRDAKKLNLQAFLIFNKKFLKIPRK